MPVLTVQKRFMQLGRVRLGEKGPKGEPRKLSTFRFTSASERLLQAVAEQHGGTVTAWEGAPDEGYWQVTTDATSLEIILPPVFSAEDGSPTVPYSQWFELWSAGGCQRRCDGVTEALTAEPCKCDPVKRDAGALSECKIVTRVSFMLPDLPGLGVWRIDSGGWNAAVELPGTLELLSQAANEMRFIPAVLSVQHRTRKVDGQTRRFVVPVIELPDITVRQLTSGVGAQALNGPAVSPSRPALPAAPQPAADTFVHEDTIEFGARPPLPGADVKTEFQIPPGVASDPLGEQSDLADELTKELLNFYPDDKYAGALGAVTRNKNAHLDDLAVHVEWLRGQIVKQQAKAAVAS